MICIIVSFAHLFIGTLFRKDTIETVFRPHARTHMQAMLLLFYVATGPCVLLTFDSRGDLPPHAPDYPDLTLFNSDHGLVTSANVGKCHKQPAGR